MDIRSSAEKSIAGGDDVDPTPGAPESRLASAESFGQGRFVARTAAQLGGELARIAVGRSAVAPAEGDRRFSDPAWQSNPLFNRLQQVYLASTGALGEVVDRWAGTSGPVRAHQAQFAASIVTAALAPTNFLPTNPSALKEAFDTAGGSVVRGIGNYLSDVRHNGGMPSMVERDAFTVGIDLALSPGAVIARDNVAEVLQYAPTTDIVQKRPVLVVPPPIGRFYFLDLRPGRSFVEYAVSRGLQTFLISWRNPQKEHADWDLDTYAARILRAIDEVREITGSDDVDILGLCAGGIITTTLLNHLAAQGDTRVHSMSYAVTLLDFAEREQLATFGAPKLLSFAKSRSQRKGLISAREMGSAFTWLRPDDLVFNYVVNNYLMGRTPPAFDILAWNADGTNLPGALHCQFLDIFGGNLMATPGALTVLGTPIDLSRITVPTFVTAALADHLSEWKSCYRTTQLLGGESTFVLSFSGHVASLVNPPGNPKAHYWHGGEPGPDPKAWLDSATRQQGSWWEAWADWVTEKNTDKTSAPESLGSPEHPVLDPAPGQYVVKN